MITHKRTKLLMVAVAAVILLIIGVVGATAYFMSFQLSPRALPVSSPIASSTPTTTPVAAKPYKGIDVLVGRGFMVAVPNGWRASVATQSSFLAIQFARPGQLQSLVYDQTAKPLIDYNGIPAWDGLTEHFYIRQITDPSQAFKPASHAEVMSEPFTFADGTIGKKYVVTKHATEAKKWGGLLKGTEWHGRVFVYEQGGKTVEAHLAFYPSTQIDQDFYESVAKSIHF